MPRKSQPCSECGLNRVDWRTKGKVCRTCILLRYANQEKRLVGGRYRAVRNCHECGEWRAIQGRGMCFRCYHRMMVLGGENRPSEVELSAPMVADRPLPPEPTAYLPGTDGKKEVMHWRWHHGFALHHPRDVGITLTYEEKCLRRKDYAGHRAGPRYGVRSEPVAAGRYNGRNGEFS